MAYETVRSLSGDIYADLGSAQVRRIPSIEEYSKGVASGVYTGDARQLNTDAAPGAGGMRYLGGYEVGDNMTLADVEAGNTNFATSTRTAGGADAFKAGLTNILKTGSASGATTAAAPSRTDQISTLRKKVADVQGQAFERQTEYTPENLRNLSPAAQAELRRQRVTALSGEMGNYNAAIEILKEEEEAAKTDAEKERTYALQSLNTYLQYGVLGSLSEEDQTALAESAGLDTNALKAISEAAAAGEPPELREVGGNLYALSWNAETGAFDTQLVLAKGGSGSGGGGGGGGGGASGVTETYAGADYPKDFVKWYETYVAPQAGTETRGALKQKNVPAPTDSDASVVSANYQYWLKNVVSDKASGKASTSADYDYGQQIIAANPNASNTEMIAALIANAGFSPDEAKDFVASN